MALNPVWVVVLIRKLSVGKTSTKGAMAFASPKEQEWNHSPSGFKGLFFHNKNLAGIESLYFVLKENKKRKGNAIR